MSKKRERSGNECGEQDGSVLERPLKAREGAQDVAEAAKGSGSGERCLGGRDCWLLRGVGEGLGSPRGSARGSLTQGTGLW